MDETKGITKINHNILVKANVIKSCIDILINLQLDSSTLALCNIMQRYNTEANSDIFFIKQEGY